ncbi:hypothetical protein CDO23_20435 (plasmid) [Sinorhizobium meliloti]|nr:hypothetical protein CDO23_20435 [Sinorhizobium meliloti]
MRALQVGGVLSVLTRSVEYADRLAGSVVPPPVVLSSSPARLWRQILSHHRDELTVTGADFHDPSSLEFLIGKLINESGKIALDLLRKR